VVSYLRGAFLSLPHPPELATQLDKAAKENGVALVGTGVNPGFVMDKLVITLAAVSQRVEHAKALRIVDASERRLPLQKKIGAGLSVEEFRTRVKEGTIKHVGLPESVAMVADSLGLRIDEITETIEPKVATERVQTEFLLPSKPARRRACIRLCAGFPMAKSLSTWNFRCTWAQKIRRIPSN